MTSYDLKEIPCRYCKGKGVEHIPYLNYVYICLPDRINDALERINDKIPDGNPRIDINQIAIKSGIGIDNMLSIMRARGEYSLSLENLFNIARALDVTIQDLLPLV